MTWSEALAEVPRRYRAQRPTVFDYTPFVSYQRLAALMSSEPVIEITKMLALLQDPQLVGERSDVPTPTSEERVWMARLKEGTRLIDIGIETGFSERSLYRKLAACRRRYDVASNYELVVLFERQGWLSGVN